MNKLIYKIRQSLKRRGKPDKKRAVTTGTMESALQQREINSVGETVYTQRRLYEKWVVKEDWHLQKEAVYLLFGIDPENTGGLDDEATRQQIGKTLDHALHCIKQNLSLSAVNMAESELEWRVRPTEFYCWASVSRISMPSAMSELMEFVVSTVKGEKDRLLGNYQQNGSAGSATGDSELLLQKEMLLGAALAVLAEFPDQCRNRKGRISVPAIVQLIQQHRDTWFAHTELKLSEMVMQDLISKWIKSLKPVMQQ